MRDGSTPTGNVKSGGRVGVGVAGAGVAGAGVAVAGTDVDAIGRGVDALGGSVDAIVGTTLAGGVVVDGVGDGGVGVTAGDSGGVDGDAAAEATVGELTLGAAAGDSAGNAELEAVTGTGAALPQATVTVDTTRSAARRNIGESLRASHITYAASVPSKVVRPLSERTLAVGARALGRVDADLAGVITRHGRPPLWGREPGFATLVQIILEQQVSLASGRAAFARVLRVAGRMTPARVARLSERQLRAAGVTRQKAAYVRGLALAVVRRELDLAAIASLDDDLAHAELVKLKGVGPWTADIYLLMALGRRDVWPRHDLALAGAMRELKRLRALPTPERQLEISDAWRPWRAVAARILWHHYLSTARMRASAAKRRSRV